MSSEERRSFLLSMTLTELAFILFFLLLLLSVFQLQRKDDVIRSLAGDDPGLASVLPDIVRWIDEHEGEDFQHLLRSADTAAKKRRELQERASQLEEARSNLGGQLKNCQRQIRGGHGLPPCWADSTTGRAEYIYRVEVREDDLGVHAHWRAHRADEVALIPGAQALVSPAMDVMEFRQLAGPVLEWSKKQDPECRHYVVLTDKAESKDGYKQKRLLIEDFFYKYEPRR